MIDQSDMDHCSWMEVEMCDLGWSWMFGQCGKVCRVIQRSVLVGLECSWESKCLEVLIDYQIHLLWWICFEGFVSFATWAFRSSLLALRILILVCWEKSWLEWLIKDMWWGEVFIVWWLCINGRIISRGFSRQNVFVNLGKWRIKVGWNGLKSRS